MNKTPKLRFKEFSDSLKLSKGSDLFSILGGAAFSSKDAKSEGIKWFKIANVGINTTDKKEISYLPNKLLDDYSRYVLKKGDITLALTRPILNSKLKVCIIDDFFAGSLLNQRVGKVINKDNTNKKYLYYLIQTEGNIRYLENMIAGTDPPNLSNSDLLMREYKVPSKEEQEKIASFFSLIDDKISLQGQKVEALKDYKKGMMQKIFSRELRFKDDDGRDYPEWEDRNLGDIAHICTGKKDTQDKVEDGIYPFFVRSQVIERINSYSFDGEAILTAGDGVGVGKVFHYMNEKFDYHQRVYKISDFSENTYGRYIYEYFRVNFIREVTKYTAKTSVDSVRMEMITKMKIPYPVLEEQMKIANVLKNIDLKIEKELEKLEYLNEYKKGLLQQMFA